MDHYTSQGSPVTPSQGISARVHGGRLCCGCLPSPPQVIVQSANASAEKQGMSGFQTSTRYKKRVASYNRNRIVPGEDTTPPTTWTSTTTENKSVSVTTSLVNLRASQLATSSASGSYSYSYTQEGQSVSEWTDLEGGEHTCTRSFTNTVNIGPVTWTPEFFEGYSNQSSGFVETTRDSTESESYSDCSSGEDHTDPYSAPTSVGFSANVAGLEIVSDTRREYENYDGTDTASETLSEEFTDAELASLVDADLAASPWLPSSFRAGHAVTRRFSSRIYRYPYWDASDEEFDDTAYETARSELVAAAQYAYDQSLALLAAAEAALATAEEAVVTAEEAVSAAEQDRAQAKVAAEALREQIADKSAERLAALNRAAHDASLSESQKNALLTQAENLQEDINVLNSEYTAHASTAQTLQTSTIPALRQTVLDRELDVEETEDAVILRTANRDQLARRVTAAQANVDQQWCEYSYSAGGVASASYTTYSDGATIRSISRTRTRYKLRVDLREYDLDGPVALRLRWRERTEQYQHLAAGVTAESTYEFSARAAVVTALPGELYVETDWFALPDPELDYRVSIVGLAVTATPSIYTDPLTGGRAVKSGICAYTPASTLRLFRRQSWGGGFPGCPAQDLPAKTYSGTDDLNEDGSPVAYSAALVAALSASGWPGPGARQPVSIDGHISVNGARPVTPTSQSATAREWRRTLACGSGTVEDVLTASLSDEFTTAELRSLVDNAIDAGETVEGSPAYSLATLPQVNGPFAVRWLSDDETEYWHTQVKYTVRAGLGGSNPDGTSVTVQYTVKTLDLRTGTVTDSIRSHSLLLPAGDSYGYIGGSENPTVFTLDPAEGELVWIDPDSTTGTEHPTASGAIVVELA